MLEKRQIRILDRVTLEAEIAAWEQQRNHNQARINWMFTTEKAREKLAKAYPKTDASQLQTKESKSL